MKRIYFITAASVLTLFFSAAHTARAADSLDILNTKDANISEWYEAWGDKTPEAKIKIENGIALIKGSSEGSNFGSVHKNITIDLDEYPALEINVISVNYYWFLIISGPQFYYDPGVAGSNEGYMSLQEATSRSGKIRYNIKKMTGLSGKQNFDLQVGVGRPDYKDNIGAIVKIGSLSFVKGN